MWVWGEGDQFNSTHFFFLLVVKTQFRLLLHVHKQARTEADGRNQMFNGAKKVLHPSASRPAARIL